MYRLLTLLLVLAGLTPTSVSAQKSKDDDTEKKEPPARVAGKTVHEWIRDLQSKDPSIKRDAIQAMQFFGKYSAEAVPNLVYILNWDPDVTLRTNVAVVLMRVEVHDKDVNKVIEALVRQLELRQIVLRYHCIVTLGRFEEKAEAAIPALVTASADQSSWEMRQAAIAALYRIGNNIDKGPDVRMIRVLINALNDPASKVRIEAIMCLATMGKIQDDNLRLQMLRNLQLRTNERDRAIVVWAYFGLMVNDQNSKREIYLNELARLLKSGDVPTKMHALRALSLLKKDARPKLPDMVAALKDEDPLVISMACNVLADMSKSIDPGDEAVAIMTEISKDKKHDEWLQTVAKKSIEKIMKKDDKKNDPKVDKKDDKKDVKKDVKKGIRK